MGKDQILGMKKVTSVRCTENQEMPEVFREQEKSNLEACRPRYRLKPSVLLLESNEVMKKHFVISSACPTKWAST